MMFIDGVTYEFGRALTGTEDEDSRYLAAAAAAEAGILTYTVHDVERVDSRHDQVAFGLKTRQTTDATLVHIVSDNSNDYIRLEMVSLHSSLLTC